ncbi:hypothetical protein [Dysosmobacter welbionis]|uniref:hypothetical protein n=1 Tax=Dysosmobacter welbionis TaxID=2093857 RepID=UPI0029429D43|nr:hypothetical protein [Dysosmobacter welbionis]
MDVTHYSRTVDCDGLSVQYDLYCPGKTQSENGKNETLTLDENLTYEQKVLAFEQAYGEAQDEIERLTSSGDRFDYAVAACSGIIAGLIDILFVGELSIDRANEWGNQKVEDFVISIAKKSGYQGNDLAGAVEYLEDRNSIAADKVTNAFGGGKQHHLRDFSHHPTPVGLFFSLLTQFTGKVYGTDVTGVFKIEPLSESDFYLIGKDIPQKLTFGIITWFFHMASDMAGSSGSIREGSLGTGLPGPLVSLLKELSALPIFRHTNSKGYKEFSVWISKLFNGTLLANRDQNGKIIEAVKFDLRTEIGLGRELGRQAIPVVINECVVRAFYFIRRLLGELKEKDVRNITELEKISWKNTLPVKNRTIVRMLTISTVALEVLDLADATLRSGGNLGMFILRVNFVGVGRFAVAGSADILMGIKKSRLELAMSSAEVAKTAQATHSVIESVEQRRAQTQSRLDQLTSKINGGSASDVSDLGREFTVGYTINDLQIDPNIFTPEEAKEVAEHIFSLKNEEFQDLKNAAWYQRFLKAITFRSGSKKLIISNITSLSKLQQLFLQIYAQHYNGLDQQLNQIIDAVDNLDSKVSKLYSGLELQADIRQFSREEAGVLQLLLCAYQSQNGREAEFQKYRGAVISIFGDVEPQGEFTPEMLSRHAGHHDVFCRCIYELAAIDGSLESEVFPPIIRDALDHLAIAEVTKRNIKKAVMRQAASFGIQYFSDEKYKPVTLDLNGVEFKDYCEESKNPQIDQAIIPDSEKSETDDSFGEITELINSKYGLDAISTSANLPGKLFQTVFKGKGSSDEGAGKELQKICGQIYDEKHPCTIAPKTIVGAMKSTPVIFTTAGIHCNLGPNRRPMPQFISYKNIDFSRTSIMRDNSGNPSGVHLYSKDDRIVAYLPMNDPDTFISVLLEASKMQTATQDVLLPMNQMPLELKLAYSKIMILFCQEFDLDWVEALRLANDLSISKEDFSLLFDYTQNIHTDADLQKQIIKLTDVSPYPNEENIATSLIEALISLIQFSTKRCREITIAERTFISRIGKMLGVNDGMIQSLIPVAQLPYRLLRKDVKADEAKGITQALTSAGALSLGTVAAFGLGSLAGSLVFNATSGLIRHQKKEKDRKAMEEASRKQLAVLKGSYHSLIKIARDLPISDELSPMILKAAVRTSPSIPEYIRSCEMNAFRSAQKTEQKDTVPQSRPCELRIYQVTETEQKNCFSVTAKVNYAPVHKGDIFALLVNDCPSARIIKVLQIGTGDRQWDEKDPDIISTFILNGIFTADELAGKTFVQIS